MRHFAVGHHCPTLGSLVVQGTAKRGRDVCCIVYKGLTTNSAVEPAWLQGAFWGLKLTAVHTLLLAHAAAGVALQHPAPRLSAAAGQPSPAQQQQPNTQRLAAAGAPRTPTAAAAVAA